VQQEVVAPPNAEAVQEMATQILDQRGYGKIHEAGDAANIWTTLVDGWRKLTDAIRNLHDGSNLTYWLVVLGLVCLLAFLIWHMIWAVRKSSQWTGWDESGPNLPKGKDPDVALSAAAKSAAEQGRRIEALSFRFRLALFRHARNHPGALRPGYTNRECLTAWKGQPAVQAAMTDVVRLLDRCWYAQQECSQTEFENAWATLEGRGVE
jgi:hypothetical protein